MTATAVITAQTTAADSAAINIPSGTTKTYYCYGLKGSERVQFTSPDSGGTYRQGYTLDGGANMQESSLTASRNQIRFNGPIDIKIEKPLTDQAVEVGEYT